MSIDVPLVAAAAVISVVHVVSAMDVMDLAEEIPSLDDDQAVTQKAPKRCAHRLGARNGKDETDHGSTP